jgi:hypothetical protein
MATTRWMRKETKQSAEISFWNSFSKWTRQMMMLESAFPNSTALFVEIDRGRKCSWWIG